MQTAEQIMMGIGFYVSCGIVFAVPFVAVGAGRIDPAARRATLGFRLLIFPGSAALWPLLLTKWLRASSGKVAS